MFQVTLWSKDGVKVNIFRNSQEAYIGACHMAMDQIEDMDACQIIELRRLYFEKRYRGAIDFWNDLMEYYSRISVEEVSFQSAEEKFNYTGKIILPYYFLSDDYARDIALALMEYDGVQVEISEEADEISGEIHSSDAPDENLIQEFIDSVS